MELDYETVKNSQIQMRTDHIKTEVSTRHLVAKAELDKIVRMYEQQLGSIKEQLRQRISEQEEHVNSKIDTFDAAATGFSGVHNELSKLRIENEMLQNRLLNMSVSNGRNN